MDELKITDKNSLISELGQNSTKDYNSRIPQSPTTSSRVKILFLILHNGVARQTLPLLEITKCCPTYALFQKVTTFFLEVHHFI